MKARTNIIITVLLLTMLAQLGMTVDSFPGFHGNGDCSVCHNEPGTAYNSLYDTSTIILDGNNSEAFWQEYDFRRMTIPVGSRYGGAEQFLTMIFAQNSSHLFVLTRWSDSTINGTDQDRYGDSDGVSIMWNINATTNFNEYYSGMNTPAAGEAVDVWTWKPTAAEEANAFNSTLTGNTYDYLFDDGGWYTNEATTDVEAMAMHGYIEPHAESEYQVEFVRKLETNDPNDVQFKFSQYYKFSVAIFNESSGSSHLMGFVHSVWVENEDIPPVEVTVTEDAVTVTEQDTETFTETKTDTPFFITYVFISLFTTTMILVYFRRRK